MSITSFHYSNYPNSYNDVPPVSELANGAKVQTFSNKVVDQQRALVSVQPSSATATTISALAGSTVDFRLENNIDRITSVWLRIRYSNTSGADCAVSTADAWNSQQQIYSNNGANLLWQTTDNVEAYLNNMFLSRNEFEVLADKRLTSVTYATGVTTIPTGSSGYVYIPIALPFFNACKIRPYTIDGNVLVRIQFAPSASIISSGTMDITETVLLLSGFYESDEQKNMMLREATLPKVIPYYSYQRHNETLTLAASTRYQIRLSGLVGDANILAFCIRSVSFISNPNAQYAFQDVENFDILDSGNRSLTGFRLQTTEDMELQYALQFDNLFISNTNAYIWSFSQSPVTDTGKGSTNGYVTMEGFNSLQFTTTADIIPGSYQILIFANAQEELRILNAQMTSSRQ